MNARMYNEGEENFLSLDPTSQYNPSSLLSDPQQLNLYAYARNNPIRYNDPSGTSLDDYKTYDPGENGLYPFGSIEGTYFSVPVYSNGDDHKNGYYQCPEFVKRFINSQYGVNLSGLGNGGDYGNQARYDAKMKNQPGSFTVYKNGGTELPKENDIISWQGSKYGHVGIVVQTDFDPKTGTGTLWTAEQNQSSRGGLQKQTILSNTLNGVTTYTIQPKTSTTKNIPYAFVRYTAPIKVRQTQLISTQKSGGFWSNVASKIKSLFRK